jgi:Double zinc ribbon
MTKLCSVCGTENRDEAQFCRSCGTAFPAFAAPSTEDAQLAAGITCDECTFQNKPGVRYCANCGVGLLGTALVPHGRSATPEDHYPGTSPPPISYHSFAPVPPYPPPPLGEPSYPPVASGGYAPAFSGYRPAYDEPLAVPDLPDPSAAIAAAHMRAEDDPDTSQPAPFYEPGPATRSGRAGLLVGLGVVLLVAAGAGGWWFMTSTPESIPNLTPAASAPAIAEPAAAVVAPPALADSTPAAALPASTADLAAMPAAAASAELPAVPSTTGVAEPPAAAASDEEAKRLAAQKRRDKAAKDKADRDARALADQQAAASRAAADAARQHAEDAQRAKAATAAAPVVAAPPPPKPRTAAEICASQGFFAEQICRSRECAAPEHAGEALCKELKDINDRRRNLQN